MSRNNDFSYFNDDDELDGYTPLRKSSQQKRKVTFKPGHVAKKPASQVLTEIAEPLGLEAGFKITYKPAQYEEVWLLDSLRSFYEQHLLADVLALLKGGKEATVYRCRATPESGLGLVAAKVYRPRKFRNLSNDKLYRQGRPVLMAEGRAVKRTDTRIMRAIGKKSAFGVQVEHTSWLMYEYTTLQRLYGAGAAVPQPLAVNENTILMSYLGDAHRGAPTLNEISLDQAEAEQIFGYVLHNIELMLSQGLIHGDLSAYNILYWNGQICLIDFPQVTYAQENPNARFILSRDIQRVCDYFERQGVETDPEALASALWERYVGTKDETLLAQIE